MNFEDIAKANETIKTTNIKGKEYAEVNQRVKAFRMLYPEGCIETEILSLEDGVVTMRAVVKTSDHGDVLGVGHAQEKEDSTYINSTSFIENCETSAVGRALGMCGLGIDTSVASAEEVETAIVNQEQKKSGKPASEKQIYLLQRLGYDGDVSGLTMKEASELIEEINERHRGGN